MTLKELDRAIPEYISILRRAYHEGWLDELLRAHLTPCTKAQAFAMLNAMPVPRDLRVYFREGKRRGRAGFRKGVYRVTLPTLPGITYGYLRAGLVLHEAAHILDRRASGTFGHGEKYCREFRYQLTQFPWRRFVAYCSDYPLVYARHRGPYTLLLTRETTARKRGNDVLVHSTDRERGPFSAEEAHDTAKMLVSDPRDNVVSAFVYSETEQQFIGAFYERGQEIPDWAVAKGTSAAFQVEPDPVVEPIANHEQTLPTLEPAAPRQPRAAKPERVAAAAGRKRGSALQLDHGNAERWPKSEGAVLVRAWFEDGQRQATAKDVVDALGDKLKALGVEFPASLVSRLKQAGFLKEVTA